ncbi:hypothetical protein SAMN05444162_1924 [Paenibacillaceae bacterium GAS479]|nr:hypothetical protein SAMN05444162_1924 [Paenibacillaceae bacterium GAS479]
MKQYRYYFILFPLLLAAVCLSYLNQKPSPEQLVKKSLVKQEDDTVAVAGSTFPWKGEYYDSIRMGLLREEWERNPLYETTDNEQRDGKL